jgi:Na+/H+ antiporter NhaA
MWVARNCRERPNDGHQYPDTPSHPAVSGIRRAGILRGIVLLACTAAALIWVNSPWAESYDALWHTNVILSLAVLASWVAVKIGMATLPEGVNWNGVHGAAWLGGIGFTMFLFVAALALPNQELLEQAKLGILVGSILAGIGGSTILLLGRSHKPDPTSND